MDADRKIDATSIDLSLLKGKIGTSQIILEGMSTLFANYVDPIAKAPNFGQLWEQLASSLANYAQAGLHDLTAAVFSAIKQILSKVFDSSAIGGPEIERLWIIWESQFPTANPNIPPSSNVAAFEAYATSLKDIYRLRRDRITAIELSKITSNLEKCVRESESPSYSSDLDSLTGLQSRVVECVGMLRLDIEGASSIIIALLARFIGLPFEAHARKTPNLTYIALSKASMDLIDLPSKKDVWQELFDSGALLSSLSNLERTILLKYQWPRQGRSPPLWRKATTTSLALLEYTIPQMFQANLDQVTMRNYWDIIVRMSRNIAHADRDTAVIVPDTSIYEDEEFDIASLTTLSNLIIPDLGSHLIPDAAKRAYTRALFTASLIHAPEPNEVPNIDNEPLKDLYDIRFGRTYDPEPIAREEMGYFCFEELVSLLRVQESSPAQVKLAKAAAPYVILRAALPLKAYIADQPLRGRLPLPASQKAELIRVLGVLREVRCEPAAIPNADGVKSKEGGHLVRLFPLIVKAVGIKGDEEVREELRKWLDKLGSEFGL
jgi:hypothetical protein